MSNRAALETNRKNTIMPNTDQLCDAFATLSVDLATGLTNLHAQIAGLEGGAADAQALQAIGHSITNLIERAQQAGALVKAADPGPQPAPLPDETAVPAPLETPETPAAPPVRRRARRAPADVKPGPGAETPDASADPAASAPEA
jgi:hypothetical protein